MSYSSQAHNEANGKKKDGWDMAIADAKKRIRELELSISVFKEHKKDGDPWPGEEKAR